MATSLGKKIRNGIVLAVLGLGLIALVVTGFGTDGMGGMGGMGGAPAQAVAEVGDEEISDREVRQRLDAAYAQAVQQQPTLDREQFIQANLTPLIEELIDSRAISEFAREHGFVVTQAMVDRIIVTIPAFQNVAGQFDDATFRQVLQRENLTEAQLREDIRTSLLVRMVTAPVGQGVRMPDTLGREYANLLLETRVGQLGAVPIEPLAQGIDPSPQQVAAFYQQNQRRFMLPERRALRYATFGPERFGDAIEPTEQEIAAYYQENQAQYGPQENRDLQLFTTQDQAAAQRLAEQVRRGTSFVEAAQAAGFAAEDVTVPDVTREQFAGRTNQELANAVFAAQQGAVVGPVRTPLGFQVVRVEGVDRRAGRPLQEVRAEIASIVRQRKAGEQMDGLVERIDTRLAEGESFEEVARAEGLEIQTTPPVTQTGQGQNYQLPPQLAPVLQTAFQMDPEEDPLVEVQEDGAGGIIVDVANVLPPAAPPLEQINDQVRQALIRQTAMQRARTIAEGVADRLNRGVAPAQAYSEADVPLPSRQEVRLRRFQVARQGEQVPPPLTVLFSIPEGRARILPAPDDTGYIIVHHRERVAGNAASDPEGATAIEGAISGISQSGGLELAAQFARAVRADVDVELYPEQIEALRRNLITGQ